MSIDGSLVKRCWASVEKNRSIHATAAQPQWGVWIACIVAVLIGSQLGSRLMAERIKSQAVKRIFGWVLLGVAALIIVKDVVLQ